MSEIMIVTRIIPRIIHFEVRFLFRHRERISRTTKTFLFSTAIYYCKVLRRIAIVFVYRILIVKSINDGDDDENNNNYVNITTE